MFYVLLVTSVLGLGIAGAIAIATLLLCAQFLIAKVLIVTHMGQNPHDGAPSQC